MTRHEKRQTMHSNNSMNGYVSAQLQNLLCRFRDCAETYPFMELFECVVYFFSCVVHTLSLPLVGLLQVQLVHCMI